MELRARLHETQSEFFNFHGDFTAATFQTIFIYLLTLFNIDYKTLAAYALIKIDYPSLPPLIKSIIKM